MSEFPRHRWSGWPGAWCLDCGREDPIEIAFGDGNYIEVDDDSEMGFHYEFPNVKQIGCSEPWSNRHNPYVSGEERVSAIAEHARRELKAIDFGDEDTGVMLDILQRFFTHWNSGGAVSVVVPILQRLLDRKPLTPLTGEESEWIIRDDLGIYAQNLRCTTVFLRTKDGPAFDVDMPDRPAITFPYKKE